MAERNIRCRASVLTNTNAMAVTDARALGVIRYNVVLVFAWLSMRNTTFAMTPYVVEIGFISDGSPI